MAWETHRLELRRDLAGAVEGGLLFLAAAGISWLLMTRHTSALKPIALRNAASILGIEQQALLEGILAGEVSAVVPASALADSRVRGPWRGVRHDRERDATLASMRATIDELRTENPVSEDVEFLEKKFSELVAPAPDADDPRHADVDDLRWPEPVPVDLTFDPLEFGIRWFRVARWERVVDGELTALEVDAVVEGDGRFPCRRPRPDGEGTVVQEVRFDRIWADADARIAPESIHLTPSEVRRLMLANEVGEEPKPLEAASLDQVLSRMLTQDVGDDDLVAVRVRCRGGVVVRDASRRAREFHERLGPSTRALKNLYEWLERSPDNEGLQVEIAKHQIERENIIQSERQQWSAEHVDASGVPHHVGRLISGDIAELLTGVDYITVTGLKPQPTTREALIGACFEFVRGREWTRLSVTSGVLLPLADLSVSETVKKPDEPRTDIRLSATSGVPLALADLSVSGTVKRHDEPDKDKPLDEPFPPAVLELLEQIGGQDTRDDYARLARAARPVLAQEKIKGKVPRQVIFNSIRHVMKSPPGVQHGSEFVGKLRHAFNKSGG